MDFNIWLKRVDRLVARRADESSHSSQGEGDSVAIHMERLRTLVKEGKHKGWIGLQIEQIQALRNLWKSARGKQKEISNVLGTLGD